MRARRVLWAFAAMVLLGGVATVVSVVPADAVTVGVTVAGGNGYGSGADQLSYPWGVALDGSGNIYVSDVNNYRVQRWAPGATSGVTVAGGNGYGSAANQLEPYGLTLDSGGNLYAVDEGPNPRVQRWAPGATSGVTVAGGNGRGSAANQLFTPIGVAVDGAGNVYVSDAESFSCCVTERVQRWAPGATSGVTVAGGNGVGSAANQLNGPSGLRVDGAGNLYVADLLNNRVQRWAPGATSGMTVAGGNGPGSDANQLDLPRDVAFDSVGNLYVADSSNNRVQRWASGATTGVTVAGGTGPGSGANQLAGPTGVAVDDTGTVFVSDSGNLRVQKWTATDPTAVPGAASVVEGNAGTTTVQVPITLSNPTSETVTAQWNTRFVVGAPAGQADPATDYTPTSGTVTFAPGETAKTVPITINGDTLVEPDEYIVVSFHDPTNAVMGGFWGVGFAGITADDNVLTPGVASVVEGNSGTAIVEVPITLSNPSTQPVTAEWNTLYAPGAPANQSDPATDYTPTSGTVTFATGETAKTVLITVNGDTLVEPDEYIVVSFHDPTNGAIGGFLGLGFAGITNDD